MGGKVTGNLKQEQAALDQLEKRATELRGKIEEIEKEIRGLWRMYAEVHIDTVPIIEKWETEPLRIKQRPFKTELAKVETAIKKQKAYIANLEAAQPTIKEDGY